jgi:glycerophosphoryl diester phosphodiesterase
MPALRSKTSRFIAAALVSALPFFSATTLRSEPMNEPTPARKLVESQRLLVIAHRGDSKLAPENTAPAFKSAVDAKADLVELDYHHTSDGVPIVIHDGTLDRTTDALLHWTGKKIAVRSKTLDELRALDAGAWFGKKFSGTKLSTLAEALDVIQAGSTTLIEHKAGDAKTCIELLDANKMRGTVVVQSFNWDFLVDCRQIAPDLTMAALGDKEITAERLDQIAPTGSQVVAWSEKYLDRKAIDSIHARGWKAWTYTVDSPDRAKQLIAAGLDGIITNVPRKMLPLAKSKP